MLSKDPPIANTSLIYVVQLWRDSKAKFLIALAGIRFYPRSFSNDSTENYLGATIFYSSGAKRKKKKRKKL